MSRLFFETTALQFSLLSPRSRLSVRCLVFKELFVAAVAATRSKFYKTSFRLVKSFSKIFLFSFRSSHFRAIKKSRCSRLIFGFPSNEVANYDRLRLFCQIFFVRFFLFSSEYTLTPCFYSLFFTAVQIENMHSRLDGSHLLSNQRLAFSGQKVAPLLRLKG